MWHQLCSHPWSRAGAMVDWMSACKTHQFALKHPFFSSYDNFPPQPPIHTKLCKRISGQQLHALCEWGVLKMSGCTKHGMQINQIKARSWGGPYNTSPAQFNKSEYAVVLGMLKNVGVLLFSTWNNVDTSKMDMKAYKVVPPKPWMYICVNTHIALTTINCVHDYYNKWKCGKRMYTEVKSR